MKPVLHFADTFGLVMMQLNLRASIYKKSRNHFNCIKVDKLSRTIMKQLTVAVVVQ